MTTTQALLLSSLLALSISAFAQPKKAGSARLASAQVAFSRGDFAAALRDLDVAATEAGDEQVLSKVHLLRGQCLGAQRDLVKAEQAFEKALENDPEAKLDPTRVDPSLVSLLEGLRDRIRGDLEVRTDRPAKISLDGKPIGLSPLKASVAIGRHRVEAHTGDGRYAAGTSVVIGARRTVTVGMELTEVRREEGSGTSPGGSGREPPAPSTSSSFQVYGGRPLADLRLGVDPFAFFAVPQVEVGFGAEWPYLRAGVHLRFLPGFGITPRGSFWVPVVDPLRAYAELELPILFGEATGPVSVGLGGAGGVEYLFIRWLSGFAEVGARNYFLPGGVQVMVQAGVRMRLP